MSGDETSTFRKAFSKGKEQGYIEALNDMLKNEETVMMMVDEVSEKDGFQVQTFVVESKHIRSLLQDIKRNKVIDN